MRGRICKILAALLTPCMIMLNCPVMAASGNPWAVSITTDIRHQPVMTAEVGKRIPVYAEIRDPQEVDVARVYFKAQDAADYSFVVLQRVEDYTATGSASGGSGYAAVLPAPAKGAKTFEYLILVKSKANIVVKSQGYAVTVTKGKGGEEKDREPLQVYTELQQAPSEITGFSDNLSLDIVESAGKFGVVAGLYGSLKSGGEGSVYGGTVAASSSKAAAGGGSIVASGSAVAGAGGKATSDDSGFSTTQIVVGSVVVLAAAGGALALAGGGGDSDSGSNTAPTNFGTTLSGTATYTRVLAGITSQGSCEYSESGGQFTCTSSSINFSGRYTAATTANVTVTETVVCPGTVGPTRTETYTNTVSASIINKNIDMAAYSLVICSATTSSLSKWDMVKP